MPRYLIWFDEGAMTFPAEDLPAVSEASHAVVRDAKAAGVWVFGAGLVPSAETTVVAPDGTVTDGPFPKDKHLGGFSILEVPSRDAALEWAAKLADACRCAQEVRELMYNPES